MQYIFEWDPAKAHSNANKHGITFEQAAKVFTDPMALTVFDEDNSDINDERWITLGLINNRHYLVVVHTYKGNDENSITIRIISARPATKNEIKQYEQG